MTSLKTFLGLLDEFVNELIETFPNEKKLKTYQIKLETLKTTNPRMVLDKFMEAIQPCFQKIVNKDESLILNEEHELIKEMNLKQLWESKNVTPNTKEAIWAHLNTLCVFGSTINQIPSGMLKNIEEIAEQCASSMGNDVDNSNLLMGMQNLLNQQLQK